MNGGGSTVRPAAVIAGLVLVGLLALAQLVQAWNGLRREPAHPPWDTQGALVSVLLTNGQVYYGEIAEQSAASLRLANVYYVQTVAAPGNAAAPSNQLVNRAKADWHGPQWMAIPTERIVFVEGVGAKSRLAELIAQEKKLAP